MSLPLPTALYSSLGYGAVDELCTRKALEIYLQIEAQQSARDLLLGALLGRAEQLRARFPGMKGRIYTELAPTSWEMLNFYNRNGFENTDGQEEFYFPVPQGAAQTPMGCQFASVPLQTLNDQQAFLNRLNAYRMVPLTLDFLTLQMQQPYFMALGFYRGGQPVSELLITGHSPESSGLIMGTPGRTTAGAARMLIQSAAALMRSAAPCRC